jgi:hypothetical protein
MSKSQIIICFILNRLKNKKILLNQDFNFSIYFNRTFILKIDQRENQCSSHRSIRFISKYEKNCFLNCLQA